MGLLSSAEKNNSSSWRIVILKAVEMMLVSVGMLSTLRMAAAAVMPRCYSSSSFGIFVVINNVFLGLWNSSVGRDLLSSPLSICIILIVALIVASSVSSTPLSSRRRRHQEQYNIFHDEIFATTVTATDFEHHDESPPPPPPPAPPPANHVAEASTGFAKDAAISAGDPAPPPPPPIPETISLSSQQQLYHDDRDDKDDSPPEAQIMTAARLRSTHPADKADQSNRTSNKNASTSLPLPQEPPIDLSSAAEALAYEAKKLAWSLALYCSYSSSSSATPQNENDSHSQPSPGKEPAGIKQEEVAGVIHSHSDDDEEDDHKEDTIESTWKAITGGEQRRPKKKQLKKSETWDAPLRRPRRVRRLDSEEVAPSTPLWKELRKATTFNDAMLMTRRGGLIRHDSSVSQQEFNQQVENFIKRQNDDRKLQRQESDQRFLDMIGGRNR